MSLKTVLQALIDALMKKSVANVSPGAKWSNVQITQSGQSVVSPCDGFAEISSGPKSMPNAYVSVESNQMFHQHELVTDGYYNHLHIPVKKGDTVAVYYHGLSETPYINFITRLGGGHRSLLATLQSGGAACLRLKNCSMLGRKGSANQRALQELKLLRPCQATGITSTSPQLMEESVFSQESACLFASTITTPEKCTTSGSGASKMFAIYLQPLSVRKGTASTSTTTKILGHHQICDAFSSLTKALPSFSANCEEVRYVA